MKRLFRHPDQGLTGCAAITLFALVYLSAMAVVFSPGSLQTEPSAAITVASTGP